MIKGLTKKIKYLVFGDVHLGNPSNKTNFIINNLDLFFKEYHKTLKELDYIFINGDLFDRLLLANSAEYNQIFLWLVNLTKYCKENIIGLRLLEGTPSHDNEQGKTMYEAIMKMDPSLDFKYIKDIEIEYIKKFNINILYVPDKNDKSASERYKQVKKLMKDNNLDKVDFAMMHGNFKYQLPIISNHAHDEEDYLSIVRYYIHINHIHIPSVYGRILAPGSFDRMIHGEEEDKGMIYGIVENENNMAFQFLKNKNARIQKTFHVNDKDPVRALDKLHKELSILPYTAFVRIISKFKLNISKQIKEMYNFYAVKEEMKSDKSINTANIFKIENDVEELHITPNNVTKLLFDELQGLIDEFDKTLIIKEIEETTKKWKI